MNFVSECLTSFILPTCFVCGAVTRRTDRICPLCWKRFADRTASQVLESKSFRHGSNKVRVRYLFDWIPDSDPALSKILVGLKGGASPESWKKLAVEFLTHHFANLYLSGGLIIPIPSRNERADHAELWGRALSDLMKLRFESPLKHQGLASQKELSAEQRRSIQFDLGDAVNLGSTVVIVDDIFTTGATTHAAVRAVRSAVKPPKTLEIWTLAHRHRLAP